MLFIDLLLDCTAILRITVLELRFGLFDGAEVDDPNVVDYVVASKLLGIQNDFFDWVLSYDGIYHLPPCCSNHGLKS